MRILQLCGYLRRSLRARVLFAHRGTIGLDAAALTRRMRISAVARADPLMRGIDEAWLVRHEVDAVIVALWFYETSAPPLPCLLLPRVHAYRAASGKPVPLAILSDDIHFLRRRLVGDEMPRVR